MMKKTLLLVFLSFLGIQVLLAQTKTITGIVKSADDGKPLPGVSVVIKGTTNGASTDIEGKYTISATPTDVLLFTFVGMEIQEILVGKKTKIDVTLKMSSVSVDEVVVTGYGKQIKSELTGSIAKVSPDDLQKVPTPSFESALQGQTSGVFIEKSSGKLGEGIKIRVRGASSLSASNQPLYVIDGMIVSSDDQGSSSNHPTNPLADINFDDIASFQILKDASAAAIYGSRAANGVVIITTKSGSKNQKTKINVSYSNSVSEATNTLDMLNSKEYIELLTESYWNSPYKGYFGINTMEDAKATVLGTFGFTDETKVSNTDWQDEMLRKGKAENFNISAIGGNEKTRFYLGLSYTDQEGIVIKNDFERLSGRLNLDHSVSEILDIGAKLNFVRSITDRVSNDNAFSTPTQLIAQAPIAPAFVDGEPNPNTDYYNGLISAKYDKYQTTVYRTLGNVYAEIKIIPELKFRSQYGVDFLYQTEDQYWGRKTQDGKPAGKSYLRQVNFLNYSLDNYFTYDKVVNDIHTINLVLGSSLQKRDRFTSNVGGKGFPSDSFQTLASASENDGYSSTKSAFAYLSYFSRINYKLMDKYLVAASFRRDGSSRFGEDARYGNFYSGSLGWIITKEDFLESLEFVSFLKLRASYGLTGNSEIGNFSHLALYQSGSYAGAYYLYPSQVANKNLEWEKTGQFNIGIDFGFFNNRINGEIDYYQKKTTDLLLSRPLPYTSGFSSITENFGELENKGFEFSINSQNIDGEFKWSTSFNIASNKNEITKLVEPITTTYNRVEEGEPIGFFYMKKYAGVDPENGDALYYLKAGSDEKTNDWSTAEYQKVGDPNPDFYGGFTNKFSFKGFDLKIFLQFVSGNDVYYKSGTYASASGSNGSDNQTKDQLKRWQKKGDITDVPQARMYGANGTKISSRWLEDGSYVRLKDITLGYNLPKNISKKFYLDNFRLYFTIQNLYTWTDYPGFDPEVNAPGTNLSQTTANIQQGIDYYTAPQSKSFTFGVNLTF